MNLIRTFLIGVIVSLSLAAVAAIGVLTAVTVHDDIAWMTIASTMSVAMFCLTSLGAAIVLEKRMLRPIMVTAIIISVIGTMLYLVAIWGDWHWEVWSWLGPLMTIIAIIAIALPHFGLLGLAKLSGWAHAIRVAAQICVLLLAVMLMGALLEETISLFNLHADDFIWRTIGVLTVLVTLGTITVPILVKMRGIDKVTNVESTRLELHVRCPRCLREQTIKTGDSRCEQCRLKFYIEIEEPRCPKCNYLLHHLQSPQCPECGGDLSAEEVAAGPETQTQTEPTEHDTAEDAKSMPASEA